MSCGTPEPCVTRPDGLGLVAPPPGQRPLRRRVGEFHGFVADLVRRVESTSAGGAALGRDWDVEGDPLVAQLVESWAYVAEIVAAYSELTAAEAYLTTASDWTDLRRLAALVGYRPRPRIAAAGWVRFEVDRGADPLVPAGTRVQAPGTPGRPAQLFEVQRDTPLRSDWDRLTATWVPVATAVAARQVRFLGEPGMRAGDLVLFTRENVASSPPVPSPGAPWSAANWMQWWFYLLSLLNLTPNAEPVVVAGVVSSQAQLGTTVVEFDRDLGAQLPSTTESYGAYRVTASAGEARRLTAVTTIEDAKPSSVPLAGVYAASGPAVISTRSIVLDTELVDLSAGQTVAIVQWSAGKCDVATVASHTPVSWEVAPGTPTRASQLTFDHDVPTLIAALLSKAPVSVYVVDRRIVARHYTFPSDKANQHKGVLRIYPAPAVAPERIAVRTTLDGKPVWEVFACRPALDQESDPQDGDAQDDQGASAISSAARGLIVELVDGVPQGTLTQAQASANLARVRHGATTKAVLGSGDATQARQRFTLPDAPIAYDLDAAGSVVPTQDVRVGGVHFDEVASLYGKGPAEDFEVQLGADGAVTVQFGDGEQGARLPTGRGNVTASYRVGGGTAGELPSEAISSLLGSVRGVKKVQGAGPTSGGADQDDERRLRVLAPARARAFGRAISIEDLVDLSLGYPGVSHAVAWRGSGPPGCACGASGLHLAFLRTSSAGVRPPLAAEVSVLAGFLDARRDVTVPLCVCAAQLSAPVTIAATIAADPRRVAADVAAASRAALLDPDGPLAPAQRELGQPLDRSDVLAVLHSVTGVLGVATLDVPGAIGDLGRRPAQRYELVVIDPQSSVGGAPA